MSKLYILSIQGSSHVTVNGYEEPHGQYFYRSLIKVVDLDNNKKLDWKIGVFTQAKNQIHEDEEIKYLKQLGFEAYYIHPWDDSRNNVDCLSLLDKLGFYDDTDEDDDGNIIGQTFDGYIFIGEIERAKAKEFSEKYMQSHYVY